MVTNAHAKVNRPEVEINELLLLEKQMLAHLRSVLIEIRRWAERTFGDELEKESE